ncbi:MAG: DUF2085 domain-containing protein [Anaerolineae bacterium]
MEIIRFLFSGICHQIPERSLFINNQPLPLCARCTGMYLGAAFTLMALWLIGQRRRSMLPGLPVNIILVLFIALWAVDGYNSTWTLFTSRPLLYEPGNTVRLVTGFGTGTSIAIVLYPIYHDVIWQDTQLRPMLDRFWQFLVVLGITGAGTGLLVLWSGAPYWLWVVVLTLAVSAVLSALNAVLVIILLHKEAHARKWFHVIPLLLVGFTAGGSEMGILALIRHIIG